ncbi:hypothetical protein [Chryseobacterium lathyri]|uniref:Uncharacterized protein n=1 Tax=Chryseobacterium lathyri TaxID=395933 RepID=A0A511Y8B0_9FLAO|nr:hypothetical protein [Chryseobacterium lathyri]GEN71431.1 hypothetical protein CLA01_15030 [Chryseobacterium lathyri]
MKKIILQFLCLIQGLFLSGQLSEPINSDNISTYFEEIQNATKEGFKVWNKDLYGSILLVDPKTRQVYSNEPNADNSLKLQNKIYIGKLPDSMNIANTSVQWSGKNWAMIMLPLPENHYERVNLLAHELFHKAQSSLGFTQSNKESNHLDQKDGRIYLRLELEALKKAVRSESEKEKKIHLTNAFIFRKYRNTLFPQSATTENQLELNEGIAEYTGFIISDRNKEQSKKHLINSTDAFFSNPTYVRSFAYHTVPVYGYLLSLKNRFWNREISANTNITDFFIKKFEINIPVNLKAAAEKNSNHYHGVLIFTEELARENKIKKKIAEYQSKFIEQPHLEIRFEKMNVSFDPRNILPIADKGTVYPNIRVIDNWGILEVENGALMSPDWSKMSISIPTKIEEQKAEGDGWILLLKDSYTIKKDEKTNNYSIIKK